MGDGWHGWIIETELQIVDLSAEMTSGAVLSLLHNEGLVGGPYQPYHA